MASSLGLRRGILARGAAWCVARGFAVGLLIVAATAAAQVDCSNPDNLCTGDPCVVPTVTVASPCNADFGSRALILDGAFRVSIPEPIFGSVSLSAGSIEVRGRVATRGRGSATVTLTAPGDIDVNGVIRVQTLTVDAGGDVHVRRPIRSTRVGQVAIDAGGGIVVEAPVNAVDGRAITLTAGGDIDIQRTVRATSNSSHSVTVIAGGSVTVAAPIVARGLPCDGGAVTIRGAGGVGVQENIDIRGTCKSLGPIEVSSSAGAVDIAKKLLLTGGDVLVQAALNATLQDSIVSGRSLTGSADQSNVAVLAGGVATVRGDIILAGRLSLFVPFLGEPGSVRVEGSSVEVGPGITINVDSAEASWPAGDIRFRSSTGDVALDGNFLARSSGEAGGTIEASAAANLTADGSFACAGTPPGCIALAAGGTLDASGASFDKPPVADCPGSPSGAFLDPAG